jgi:ATP-dependent 26S proteasome regulatory subunit
MNSIEANTWSISNQQYITGLIALLRRQIEKYYSGTGNTDQQHEFTGNSDQLQELDKLQAGMQAPPSIERIVDIFGLSVFERNILVMCAAMELDSGFAEMIARIQGEQSLFQPSLGLALAALPGAHWSAVSPGGGLRYWRLLEVNKMQLVTKSPLKIDEHILHFIAGVPQLNEKLREVVEPVYTRPDPMPSQVKQAENILQIISQNETGHLLPLMHLTGIELADKMTAAAYVSNQIGSQLFIMSAFAVPMHSKDNMELARLWSREAILNNYVLFIDCSNLDSNDKPRLQSVAGFIENLQGLIFINSEQWSPQTKRNILVFNTEKPTRKEQMLLWKNVIGDAIDPKEAGLGHVVSQFNLTADTIRKAGVEIADYLSVNGNSQAVHHADVRKKIWKVCCSHSRPQVDELAQRIEPVATWDDIVLPETQKNILKEISAQVKQRIKVYDEWGFAAKGSRGLGISALFAGESGTGKTMASEVLANELGLDLYKIDLSKVVNKYIGETEKNLKRIFDAAEDGGAILLFDEADALFGKRSDVKDSHDRYSNIEVSYLLQRMEAYRGLAILTTNMKNALDKAFMRRIRFVINFPFPDATQRTEIWNRIFPAETPRQELDLDRLSKLTIPGGSIRNIALNAAFYAADENNPVRMSHIYKAARTEYDKIDKPFNNMDFKAWQ